MANITLNIERDLNIYVSEEDGQPDSLYLDGVDGFPETLRIHLEADGEDDESKAEVIYAIPGAAAISMTLYEALTLALNSGGADSLELMPVSGIFIAFMAFFNSAVGVLQTLVIALGAGLAIWGVVNLMEGYGNDNPGANAHVR